MTAALLLSSSFFAVILIFCVVMIFEMKGHVKRMDEMYNKNFDEVKDELAEIKSLFKKEVSDVFKNIKRII